MNEVNMPQHSGAWRGKIELLAPAGSMEKLKAAVLYGADAVYMAGQAFGLRAFSKNFTAEEMFEARRYCTDKGVRLYITCNIMAHPDHMAELDDYIQFLRQLRPDGVIISDPGVFLRFSQTAPELVKHISTQASVTNAQGCLFWQANGAKRIVLARELSLRDIRAISAVVPPDLELEAFVHGAMCMAYSGRCLLSNMLTGRGANQGECAQICRWEYKLIERKRLRKALEEGKNVEDNYQFSLEEDNHGTYLLSSKDLCMIEHIPDLVDAGVTSFKIEGRMKGAYYVAMTIRAYRLALDAYLADPENYHFDPAWKKELLQMTHREYGTGFYYDKVQDNAQVAENAAYQKEATIAGIVLGDYRQQGDYLPLKQYIIDSKQLGKRKQRELEKSGAQTTAVLPAGRYVAVEERNFVDKGDELEIIVPHGDILSYKVTELYDANGLAVERINQAQAKFYLPLPEDFPVLTSGTFIRKKD